MAIRIFENTKKMIGDAKARNATQQGLDRYQNNLSKRYSPSLEANTPFQATGSARDNYQTYPYDYYAGADCKIFFGDIWVDDIVTCSWTVNQSKTPIYGYASQYYDAIAKGQVLVQGNLSITFKETGYLNVIQSIIENQRKNAQQAVKRAVIETNIRNEKGLTPFIPRVHDNPVSLQNNVSYASNGEAQIIRQEQTIEEVLMSKIVSAGLSKKLLQEKGAAKYRDFEDFAELLEDSIWGDSNGNPFNAPLKLRRADEFDYSANGGIQVPRNDDYGQALNILLTFGDLNDFRAEHTLVALNDVHFVSTSMVVSPAGDPVAESYDFIARDINKSLSKEILKNINPIKLEVPNFDGVTSLPQIEAIEQQLRQEENRFKISVNVVASLTRDGKWDSENWYFNMDNDDIVGQSRTEQARLDARATKWRDRDPVTGLGKRLKATAQEEQQAAIDRSLDSETFNFNNSQPFLDQVINLVQREFNELKRQDKNTTAGGVVDVNNSQYILEVEFRKISGTKVNSITMVLQQKIPNSMSYVVISPTRSNFASTSVITRDDLWQDIEAGVDLQDLAERDVFADYQKKENETKSRKDQIDKERLDNAEALAKIREERTKELQKKLNRAEKRRDELLEADGLGSQFGAKLAARRAERLRNEIFELNEPGVFSADEEDVEILRRRDRGKYRALLEEEENLSEESQRYQERLDEIGEVTEDLSNRVLARQREEFRRETEELARQEELRKKQEEQRAQAEKADQEQAQQDAAISEEARQESEQQELNKNTSDSNALRLYTAPEESPGGQPVLSVYDDIRGISTTGIGFNVEDPGASRVLQQSLDLSPTEANRIVENLRASNTTLTAEQSTRIFNYQTDRATAELRAVIPRVESLPAGTRLALGDTIFQTGLPVFQAELPETVRLANQAANALTQEEQLRYLEQLYREIETNTPSTRARNERRRELILQDINRIRLSQ